MEIVRPSIIETTAYGVALGSLVGSGRISLQEIKNLWKEDKRIKPAPTDYHKRKSILWEETIKKLF
jgi:glycerol kinase